MRRRGNVGGTDWAIVALSGQGDKVVGAALKGDLGVGWHFAAAYRMPHSAGGSPGAGASWQAVAGADYSWLNGRLLWLGEFYVQRDGVHRREDYTYQQLSYRFDEFASGTLSLLAQLPTGERTWNAAVNSALDEESKAAVGFSIIEPGEVAATTTRPIQRSYVELSQAF